MFHDEVEVSAVDESTSTTLTAVDTSPREEFEGTAREAAAVSLLDESLVSNSSNVDDYSSTVAMFTNAMFSPVVRRPLSPDSELVLKLCHEEIAKEGNFSPTSSMNSSSVIEYSPVVGPKPDYFYPNQNVITSYQKRYETTLRLKAEVALGKRFNQPMLSLADSSMSLIYFDQGTTLSKTCSALVANIRESHGSWTTVFSPMVKNIQFFILSTIIKFKY